MFRILLFLCVLSKIFLSQTALGQDEELHQSSLETRALIQMYTEHLFPHHDPFYRVFDLETGKVLFQRMCLRKIDKKSWGPSPLARVNEALKFFLVTEKSLDKELIQNVLMDAKDLLKAKNPELIDLQSNLLALDFLSHYLQRFEIHKPDESSEAKPEEKKNSKEDKDTKGKEKQKPRYPKTSDKYKPHTKDTEKDKEKGSKEDQVIVLETNFETPYFGQRFFSEIIRGAEYPFQELALPGRFANPKQERSKKHMIVRTLGERKVPLFIPPSHTPLQASDPRAQVIRTAQGAYELSLTQDLEEVIIPLKESTSEILSPVILEVYTRPVGFKREQWPSLIQSTLFQKYNPDQDHTKHAFHLAQEIAAHLASNYLYSVGERPELDPIDALNAGAFQCDMASFAMVGLLRDVYKIPSRAVSGFRAKKHGSGADKKSYLVLPGEAHAWVEAYINGRWIPFDPTPVKKDKKDDKKDENGEKDEYSDRALENPLVTPPENEEDSKGDSSSEKKRRSG